MVTDKEIKTYISKVKTLLPIYSKQERQFISNIKASIYSFLDSNKNATLDDIVCQFGEPIDIVQGYIDSLDIEVLINRMSIKKILLRIFLLALVSALIALSIYSVTMYKAYQRYVNTIVVETETVIDHD